MVGRLLRLTGTVLVIAVAFVTPELVTSTPASADTVVNGCTIVSNPTPTNFTNCPDGELYGANLSGVNLSFANLAGARFVDCLPRVGCGIPTDLTGANLTDANLSDALLISCPDPGLTFCPAASLTGTNLSGANLTDAQLSACFVLLPPILPRFCGNVDLTNGTLTGADLTDTVLVPFNQVTNQVAEATSSAGAVVTWTTPPPLPGATPSTCTPPSGSIFPIGETTVTCQVLDDQGDVATGTFTMTVLRPITLISTPCKKLAGCKLSGFDLSYTNLFDVDLHGANLIDANLSSDVLSQADLGGANLMGANMSGADLSGAILKGANLNDVTWSKTTCPDGTNSDNDGGTCIGHL